MKIASESQIYLWSVKVQFAGELKDFPSELISYLFKPFIFDSSFVIEWLTVIKTMSAQMGMAVLGMANAERYL